MANCTKTRNCCFPSSEKILEENTLQSIRSCLYPMVPQPSADQHLYQSLLIVSSVQRNGAVGLSNKSCGDVKVAPQNQNKFIRI